MIAVLITDGRREYMERTLASCQEMIPEFAPIIVDDSGDAEYAAWLDGLGAQVVHHPERQGLAAAVRTGWTEALKTDAEFVWHHEDDFTLTMPVEIHAMARVLCLHPYLAQLVLKRQPWSEEEITAGGQIEVAPGDYVDRHGFVEHGRLFSFNPCLIPRHVVELALQEPSDGLERGVTDTLTRHLYRFAYWGARDDPPRCHHIGEHRSAGYRW